MNINYKLSGFLARTTQEYLFLRTYRKDELILNILRLKQVN